MSCLQNCHLCCAVSKLIACNICHCACLRKPSPSTPEFNVVCIGLTNAGKTTLLSLLSRQSLDDIVPTTGFMIKACRLDRCILNVKEIGGAEKMRQYWQHYYHGMSAVVFVLDSADTDEELEVAIESLKKALNHHDLAQRPCLILANCQDKAGAKNEFQIQELLKLSRLPSDHELIIQTCSRNDLDSINAGFDKLSCYLLH